MAAITDRPHAAETHQRVRKRKTPQSELPESPVPAKKPTPEDRIRGLATRCLAKVTYHADYERAANNCAYLSTRLYNKLFGRGEPNGQYLRMANVVCRAFRDPSLTEENLLDVNFITYENIEEHLFKCQQSSCTWVSPYDIGEEDPAYIEKAHFVVSPCGVLNTYGGANTQNAILTDSLETLIRSTIGENPLSLKQALFIMHPVVGPLKLVLQSWKQDDVDEDAMLTEDFVPYYGCLREETTIRFTTKYKDRLLLVEEFDPEKIETFYFKIAKAIDVSERVFCSSSYESTSRKDWKKGIQPLPLIVSYADLIRKIRERFTDKLLQPGKAETFRHDSDWKYKVQLIKVKVLPGKEDDADTEDREGNPKLFCFQKDHSTHITYTSEVILTTHFDNAREADALTFEIMDMDSSRELKDSEIHWVSTKEVEEKIKANKQRLAIGGKIVLKIGHTKYLLKLIKASGKECPHPHETQNLKDVWNANENTEIKVYPNSSLDLEIVDTPQPYTLDSLTVKVSTQDGGGQGGLSLIFGLTEEGDGEKTIVPEKELKKIFLESLPTGGIIHEKQTFTGITGKGEKIKFKLDKLKSKEREGKTFYRGCMYKCLPATEISLEGEKGSAVVISTQPKEINFENIDKKLVEFGIGGMSEQFKDVIARTLLSRSTYSGHIVSLGQKPSRGLLLYGPPGTGKTLLARQLGNILGVTNERIKLLTGSQIWSKWVGDSEKNVRGIFKEARDDQNRHGKDSPLHLLIIDEIDAFLQDRANAERRYETSVVNTFIAELDGLSSNGEDSLNNVIVIGLTNFPDRIDEAVKRPGRLFPHIHIGMPDSAGRKEIFEIHMKNIREGGFLAEDVDMDELIKMTVGRAGAFIEGLVAAAAEYSLKRLWEQRIPVEAIKDHPAAKLYREDFRKAFQECIHQKKKEEKPIIFPATPRQVEEVAQDLRLFGLGGLPSEALQFLSDLKNAQYYKKFLCAMKHPFPRGALLYGPPGIGKRSFAKAIQKLFTLDGQRFQQLKASELWPMQGSHLKAKIEKIIQPARDAAKDLKDDAPLHVVVIDEIDMLYYHKRETDSHDLSVLNQFLMELESLFEGDPKEVNNLLVIGIANRPAFGRLSDGILRHGRLGKHIEMTLPNAKGRREIFEIYLKEYREKEKLDRDVNFDELVEMTRDYSGAYIEGLVSEAGVRMMRRMAAMNVDPSTMLVDEYPKLTMADLKEAHEVMKNDETWKTMMI